ncbi:uncharacterized protein MELLADRAFT_111296 [Melampsora larici-populina 98AG31]|uniref:Uncharacterized protein n=1 Tax=Melampsora larici-populina (strain 98AG31 / pathotype 3-4-7) TaxID=747676 RepID=F4S2N9_MELLP|nr:uncharacterized protein MELLADRAFT_111296 [Melampsora larici-populina 98AG31]EGG01032.1 hypothetical protein MELLADRAFT_111296 [Melampsora larici-populina 98AG31]
MNLKKETFRVSSLRRILSVNEQFLVTYAVPRCTRAWGLSLRVKALVQRATNRLSQQSPPMIGCYDMYVAHRTRSRHQVDLQAAQPRSNQNSSIKPDIKGFHNRLSASPENFIMAMALRALVLEDDLHVFLQVAGGNVRLPLVTTTQLVEILAVFHPGLRLGRRLSRTTAVRLFDLLVRPFIEHMESFDEETNIMSYWEVPL